MEKLFGMVGKDYILAVEGAVSTKDNGLYNVIGRWKGEPVTAYRAIKELGEQAAYVIAVGTCASDGGISAARPNPAQCVGIQKRPEPEGHKAAGLPLSSGLVYGHAGLYRSFWRTRSGRQSSTTDVL